MKIDLNFNEEEVIKKLAEDNLGQYIGQYTLQSKIVDEIKRQVVQATTQSIKEKLIDIDWYGKEKDYFKDTIQKEVFAAIEKKIENLITSKFSEVSVENMINRKTDKIFNDFIEKKINEKLEQAKADLQFYSLREHREEQEAEEDERNAEVKGAYEDGLKNGYEHK